MKNYNDIINLPHPTSATHPRMAVIDRAAQFSPFAALTGYEAAVKETARLTDTFVELDECEKVVLDEILKNIHADIAMHPEVTITYFCPDEKKAGGSYLTVVDKVKKIDKYEKCIVLMDGKKIEIEKIVGIEKSK